MPTNSTPFAFVATTPPTSSNRMPLGVGGTRQRALVWGACAPLCSSVLLALALPEHPWGFTAWFSLVPLILAIEKADSAWRAFVTGWLAGTATNAMGLYWMIGLLERLGGFSFHCALLAYAGLCAYQGLVFGMFGGALHLLRRRALLGGHALALSFLAPLVMVACELPMPFVFPWNLAMTQAWNLPVIQLAEYGGPFAVTAVVMLINGALAQAVVERKVRPLVMACGLVALVCSWGGWRIAELAAQEAAAPKLVVGIAQGNVAPSTEPPDMETRLGRLRALQHTSQQLDEQGAELLLWTETAYPFPLPSGLETDYPSNFAVRIRRDFRAPLVLGAATIEAAKAPNVDEREQRNSAYFLASDDRFTGRYDKNELVAFGERAPFEGELPMLAQLKLSAAGHFRSGKSVSSFALDHRGQQFRLAPLICLEDILSDMGRRVGALHPHLLVNLTNDAWFGPTSEPAQHLALAVFRSVEQRVAMVRAVNTGASAFIHASGEVSGRTESATSIGGSEEALGALGSVALIEGGNTFYARHGNLFAELCLALMLLALARIHIGQRPRALHDSGTR